MRVDLQQVARPGTGLPRIAIVGLGFSGAAAAAALLAELRFPFSLFLIDANQSFGGGLAYGRAYAGELLDVRARDLSLLAGERGDFAAWLQKTTLKLKSDLTTPDLGQIFAPRAVFGDYVRARLFAEIRRRPDVSVQLIAEEAVGMSQAPGNRLKIRFANGVPVECDIGVLATGYGTGKAPRRFGADPFVKTMPSDAADAEKIILVGSSLTMVDTLLRLRRVNRNAQITIISRNARLPLSQLRYSPAPSDFKAPATLTARRLLNALREQCRDAMARGDSWQAVINGLRSRAQGLWTELPTAEQQRFLRLLKTHWDVHRHRIPGDVYDSLALEFALPRTERIAGEVKGVSGDGPFDVAFRLRGRREITVISAGYVFDCSGWRPEINAPLHRDLMDRGIARTDAHRLGFTVSNDGRVTDVTGNARIFAIGPLCTGSLFEITAAPEIAGQACRLATSINAEIKLAREVSYSESRAAAGR